MYNIVFIKFYTNNFPNLSRAMQKLISYYFLDWILHYMIVLNWHCIYSTLKSKHNMDNQPKPFNYWLLARGSGQSRQLATPESFWGSPVKI